MSDQVRLDNAQTQLRSPTTPTSPSWPVACSPQRELRPGAVDDPDADALVASARDLADRLLGGMGRRWSHTRGVARRAAIVAASLPVGDRPALVAAAWLHDIGYAEPLKRTGFHPLDGACFLLETGWGAPVPGLVAHHSGARFVAAVRGLSPLMHRFEAEEHAIGRLADALTYADQTTGPDGLPITVEDRFADMLDRHGPHSPQAQAHGERAPAIRAAIRRTEQRLLAAGAEQRGPGLTGEKVFNLPRLSPQASTAVALGAGSGRATPSPRP